MSDIEEASFEESETLGFLRALYGKAGEGYVSLWTKSDKQSYHIPVSEISKIQSRAQDLKSHDDTYFGVGLRANDSGPTRRGSDKDVIGIPGVWLDVDIGQTGHASKKYPPTLDEALDILWEIQPLPTLLVWSGYGLHAYWLFTELWKFNTEEDRQAAAEFCRSFQCKYISSAKQKGFSIDNTSDLARVLRVPGTFNYKVPQKPQDVRLLKERVHTWKRYTREELIMSINMAESRPTKPPTGELQPTLLRNLEQERESETLPSIERVAEQCGFLNHCRTDAKELGEDEWYAALTIIAKCSEAVVTAHQWSEPYPTYDHAETQYKLAKASKAKPRTCDWIAENTGDEYCQVCPHRGRIGSPIALGYPDGKDRNPRRTFDEVTDLVDLELGDFLNVKLAKREGIIEPWLSTQGLAMLYGSAGVGKTNLAMSAALSIANGTNLLNWDIPRARGVLYLDGEMPAADLQERFIKLGAREGTRAPIRIVTPDLQPGMMPDLGKRHFGAIERLIDDTIEVVFLDNLSCWIRTGEENFDQAWLPMQEFLLYLRTMGKSVVILHHAGKVNAQRGTSKRVDMLDSVLALRKPKKVKAEQGAVVDIVFEKSRGFAGDQARSFTAALVESAGTRTWQRVAGDVDEQTQAVATLLREGVAQKDIAAKLNVHPSTVSRIKGKLPPSPKVFQS